MTPEELAERLRDRVQGSVAARASLGAYTTFRVGGPADVLVEAESEDDLRAVADVASDVPVTIVGRGSNLLVADEGFRGIAVRLGRSFRRHEATPEGLLLGGAVYLPAAARLCVRLGLSGFEFAAEIPATFGGAVRMNAGAHERCMADVLTSARVIDLATGEGRHLDREELGLAYRHSDLRPSDVVVDGTLALQRGEPEQIAERNAAHVRWRRETQPPGRSAGSVFCNPPGDSAGRLIDAVGAKGMRIGGAEVSSVHANFIVADPGAKAADVFSLIGAVRALVLERTGVTLEPEVRFLGSFDV